MSLLNKYGIETRPIIAGNIVKQPFMEKYVLNDNL